MMLTDMIVHGIPGYGDQIDRLILEIWPLCGTAEQDELRQELPPRPVDRTELD